ncbi:PQQ-binding-like beta-propeller repeat protein [Paeniglutamicibacter sp. NPDC012692]|uniref:outer membrane protein assembly factor BamB family protein n=1 Tax=Paeniglutamicibacter sp. NPDC012692 TaxID=3364388 RepID=UPI00369979FE
MTNPYLSRRTLLQAGGTVGLAAALGLSAGGAANASGLPAGRHGGEGTEILDLGPAVVQFALMSSVLVGDVLYIGSRNVDPVQIVAYHVPTGKVVGQTELATGHTIQTMAADATGRYLYAGVLQKSTGPQPNLYRWDLGSLDTPATPVGRMGDRDVRDLSVAPDGRLYAVGGGSGTAPALWEYDPATSLVKNLGIPDAGATLARAVAATDHTVFFGAGSTLGGGGSAGRACLYAYDRTAATFTPVTPESMLADPSIRDLAILGDKLVVGTAASTRESRVALMDLEEPASHVVATSIGKTAKNFAAIGEHVYFANEAGICDYSIAGNTITQLALDGPSLGEIWGVDSRDGKLLVTSGYGFIAEIDPGTGALKASDLGEAGAQASAQTVMGIAAGGGFIYVGGNGVIARRGAKTGEVTNLQAQGEAKDAVVVDGVLYTGQYSSQGIWSYDPRSSKPIHQAADFPAAQNRPLDVCWDAENRLVLVAAQSDTEGGGSFWTYKPRTGAKKHFINPIDDVQLLRAVATRNGVAFLGGGLSSLEGAGTVVAFDPVVGKELWRIEPQMDAGLAALAVQGRNLYGLTRKGGLFVIDVPKRSIVHRSDISAVSRGFGALVANRGRIYGVSDTTVFRFDPKTFAVSTVMADTGGAWYSGSHIANDESGYLYTMRGRNLVRINDRPRR